MPEKILIVDDEVDLLEMLKTIIEQRTSYQVSLCSRPLEVMGILRDAHFDLVIIDLRMPDLDGLALLEKIRREHDQLPVIIVSAYGTIDSAVNAMQQGAFSYITKPLKPNEIITAISKALDFHRLKSDNLFLRRELAGQIRNTLIFGSNSPLKAVSATIRQVARTTVPILISGEPGTGKKLVARTIHAQSPRREHKFVSVNLAIIPATLTARELFGQVKGYLPDVFWDRKGAVEEAHRGTLFLEEVGNLDALVQTQLNQLLQEGEYLPLGAQSPRSADIRCLASTREDLGQKGRERAFLKDLYHRLDVIPIVLPPLRERREDIPLLVRHFLEQYARVNQKEVRGLAPEALDLLMRLEWPGNIRELENIIARGVILNTSGIMEVSDLFPRPDSSLPSPETEEELYRLPFKEAKDRLIARFHREYIQRALSRNGGIVSLAARESGLERPYFHKLMRELQLTARDFKKGKSVL